MGRSIENPGFVRIFDRIRGIEKGDRTLAQMAERQNKGQGEVVLVALARLKRMQRNPFIK